MTDMESVHLGHPTYRTADGIDKYAVWGYSPTSRRVAIMRYITEFDALTEAAAGTLNVTEAQT